MTKPELRQLYDEYKRLDAECSRLGLAAVDGGFEADLLWRQTLKLYGDAATAYKDAAANFVEVEP